MGHLSRRSFISTTVGGTVLGSLPIHTARTRQSWTARLGPVEGSQAQGFFALTRLRDGARDRMAFALAVRNIEQGDDVTQSHIHDRDTGEILVWLYPIPDGRGAERDRFFGAVGRFRDDDMTGRQDINDIDDLVAAMDMGETIVNVHSERYPVVATGLIR